jgi:protein TonB
VLEATAASASAGPGADQGAGSGRGAGAGAGLGSGAGDGLGGGSGGGAYQVGNGVTAPLQLSAGKPQYTAAAMRAHLQGVVVVECVVDVNGRCAETRVKRSLDPAFGLDEQAIVAARQWRFRPGTRLGQPVPVWVTLEIGFVLH